MTASNSQVQAFSQNFGRPLAEKARAFVAFVESFRASIDDVYANLTNNSSWTDTRTDSPPHLMVPNDLLGENAWAADVLAAMKNHSEWPTILKCCVQPVG